MVLTVVHRVSRTGTPRGCNDLYVSDGVCVPTFVSLTFSPVSGPLIGTVSQLIHP